MREVGNLYFFPTSDWLESALKKRGRRGQRRVTYAICSVMTEEQVSKWHYHLLRRAIGLPSLTMRVQTERSLAASTARKYSEIRTSS
jgi:hypothetical protein